MSPVGANLDFQSSSPRDSSLNDSSQTNDGYIHMAPVHNHCASPQQVEGYLDMAPLSSSLPKTFPGKILKLSYILFLYYSVKYFI